MFGNTFNKIHKALRNDEGMATELAAVRIPDFLRIRYGGTGDAKRRLGSVTETRNAFVDVQGHLFRV